MGFFPPLSGFRKARIFSEKGLFLENVGCIKSEGRARGETLRGLQTHRVQSVLSGFLLKLPHTSFKSPLQSAVGAQILMLQSAFPGWPRLLAPWTALEGAKVSISDSQGEAGKVCARTNRRKFFQNTHSPLPSIRTFKLRVTRSMDGGAWRAAVCGVAKSQT